MANQGSPPDTVDTLGISLNHILSTIERTIDHDHTHTTHRHTPTSSEAMEVVDPASVRLHTRVTRAADSANCMVHSCAAAKPTTPTHASTSDTPDADVGIARCCSDFAGGFLLAWMGVLMPTYTLAHAAG